MKVFIINLPWEKGGLWGVRAGSRWPHIKTSLERHYSPFPFFMAYAAALLKREGVEVCLIDSLAEQITLDNLLSMIDAGKPDLVVAETSSPSLLNDLMILNKLPAKLPVALCGPEVSIRDLHFLKERPRITYVFVGEYEFTLLELVQCLKAGQDLSGVKGLIYRAQGQCVTNPPRPLLENLDDLPWPLRDGLPMEKYNDTPGGIPFPSVQMWSSRGCPYHCLFCSWPQLMYQSHRYRTRSVTDVVDEMEYLVNVKGFKSVYFDDDTMNVGKQRMMALADEIKRRCLNVPWAMMARADLMEEDVLENLCSAGLAAVKYGVESGDQRLVDNINKKLDLQKLERMVRFTQSIGIKTHLTFTFGLPGETHETIQKTIDFARHLDPDTLQFSITTAFPGTQYYRELETRGHIVSRDLQDYDGNSRSMLRTACLSAKELQRAKQDADWLWQEHVWATRKHVKLDAGFRERCVMFGKKNVLRPLVLMWRSLIRYCLLMGRRLCSPNLSMQVKEPDLSLIFLARECFLRMGRCVLRWGHETLARVCALRHWYEPQRVWLKKLKNNVLNLMGVHHGAYAFKGPDCVQIDLTSNCNNNCVSCWCNSPLLKTRMYKGAKRYKTLPTPMVLALMEDLVGLGTSELYFSGGGEPFMHPDLMTIVAQAKARGLHCCINTNFTLVDEAVIKQLIDLSVDALTVSFWAANPESYVRTHPNKDAATFERMTQMLRLLNTAKDGRKPYIKIYNVISNLNYTELEEMVAFAEETGSESVEFAVVDTIPGATDQLLLNYEQRQAVLAQCSRIMAAAHKVKVLNLDTLIRRFSDVSAQEAQYDSGIFQESSCYVGWVFSRIMSNGDVNFCLKAHRMPVGNLYEHSFRAIWNSAKQQEFRGKALKFDKDDSFFKAIGNDENCKMGCYKSCDDIGRNMVVQEKMKRLSSVQKTLLTIMAKVMGRRV
ncbi:MAG: radical SAM protein [Candidatus Omnitrophota bacterium]